MDAANQYAWVAFYKELAGKLLSYKHNRHELVDKVKSIFTETGIRMPTLERGEIIDIDPFTIFGLFNKTSMKDKNRTSIAAAMARLLDIKTAAPTSYEGVPTLNNQNATFYYFVGERMEHDIDELWDLFESALRYADDPSEAHRFVLSRYFDMAINKKGNGNSKITMGLYWIAPNTFLTLDNKSQWYIYESGQIPTSVVSKLPAVETKISSSKYFEIVEKLQAYFKSDASALKDFKDLSFAAQKLSPKVKKQEKEKKTRNQRETKGAGLADEDVDTVHYWLYSPGKNASKWNNFYNAGIMAIGWGEIGDLKAFSSKDEINQKMKEPSNPGRSYTMDALAAWQFANEMKPGDVIFAKKDLHLLIGCGIVQSDYKYDDSQEDHYNNVRKVKWTHNLEIDVSGQLTRATQFPSKTLTDITSHTEYVEKFKSFFVGAQSSEDTDFEEEERIYTPYSKEQFLKEVYMDEKDYDTLVGLLDSKMNVVLQGAPGVGKTYAAKRLAYSIVGEKNPERVMMVQFHQSYTYEDFIEGFRPSEKGISFDIKKGVFYKFCKTAQADDIKNKYFFIIDEINRGNISKIFGELFMLIESDKRGNELQLLYSNEKFSVPANVYIIGTMNTADRSLAMLDYALRRRFAFFEMKPGFDTKGFGDYRMTFDNPKFNSLIGCIKLLNDAITKDDSLGEGFCIGHSYFCDLKETKDEVFSNIIDYELVPLLKEYWFDEPVKVNEWSEKLRRSIE